VKPKQGIRINRQKYTLVQNYVDSLGSGCYTIVGRRKRAGFIGAVTHTAIIIALFSEDEGQTITMALSRVSKLAGYLLKQGV